jgi:hypothetical protein
MAVFAGTGATKLQKLFQSRQMGYFDVENGP